MPLPLLFLGHGGERCFPLTRKGPCSVRKPSRELQPGPPLSQSTTGLLLGSFWDSTNLGRRGQAWVGAGGGASPSPPCCQAPSGIFRTPLPPHPAVLSPGGHHCAPSSPPAGRKSRGPVVEMLGARAFEVARVLAERWLLGQPRQTLDLVLIGGCLASGRPEQQQRQEEERRQRGSDHLRRSGRRLFTGAPAARSQPSLGRSWRRSRPQRPARPPRLAPRAAGGSGIPPSLRRPLTSAPPRPCSPGAAGGWQRSCVAPVTCAPASRDGLARLRGTRRPGKGGGGDGPRPVRLGGLAGHASRVPAIR